MISASSFCILLADVLRALDILGLGLASRASLTAVAEGGVGPVGAGSVADCCCWLSPFVSSGGIWLLPDDWLLLLDEDGPAPGVDMRDAKGRVWIVVLSSQPRSR